VSGRATAAMDDGRIIEMKPGASAPVLRKGHHNNFFRLFACS